MKQHPIPQNILDIEFKLFSRFTIREFIYMAIGISTGSIFLFIMSGSKGTFPPVLAIILFLLCSGIGLFFGLAKINDQNADTYLRNFISSITTPTLRVWKNKTYDEKQANLTPKNSGIPQTAGKTAVQTEIIGSSFANASPVKAAGLDTIRRLDTTESQRLITLSAMERATLQPSTVLPTTANPTSTNPTSVTTSAQESTSATSITQTQLDVPTNQPNTTNAQPVVFNTAQNTTGTVADTINQNGQTMTQNRSQPKTQTPVSGQSNIAFPTTIKIQLDRTNIIKFQIDAPEIKPQPNNINFKLVDFQDQPIAKAVTMIKTQQNEIVQVKVSDESGWIKTDRQYAPGRYSISIQHPAFVFPEITYVLEGGVYPPIKLIPIQPR